MEFPARMSRSNLRVVLLGMTGSGKSSLGNTLLGLDVFHVEKTSCFSSVTFKCQWEETVRFGTLLQVTDTPGVSDTDRPEDEVLKEVAKSIAVASPGPHVIIMVLRCDMRFTQGEFGAYKTLKCLFGDNICNYMIVVFVGSGVLGRPQERGKAIALAIQMAPQTLKEVLSDAGGRYCSVDNMASRAERDQQAHTIITAIQNLVSQNGNAYFTSQLCEEVSQQVEKVVQHRMETSDSAVTHEVAVRDTRKDIVADRVEPSFMKKLLKTVGDAVILALAKIAGAAVKKVGKAALAKCSVM